MFPLKRPSERGENTAPGGDSAKDVLQRFENQLDSSAPESGVIPVKVTAYGEVSVVLSLEALPGLVCKRMSGFSTKEQATKYMSLVRRYCNALEDIGVSVVPTDLVEVDGPNGGYVVYLLQPELPREELGNEILRNGDDDELFFVVSGFLERAERIFSFNHENPDNLKIAADSQISNWHAAGGELRLLDVGTPCYRIGDEDLFDSAIIGKAMPPPIRFIFDRAGLMKSYFDSYYDPREIIVDHVANYIKEGRPDRMRSVLDFIHGWIREKGDYLKLSEEISIREIKAFYRKDVILLEAFLQCRRLDRFIRTRILGKPYDYILPGKIARY